MEIHLISTGQQTKEQLAQALSQVHSYINYIHLREKNWRANDFLDVIARLIELGIPKRKIVINDRVDVAHVTNAGGVQLGTHSFPVATIKTHYPNLRVGCSIHSPEEAVKKERDGADYLVFGHVFPTASKPGLTPRGLHRLKDVVQKVSIPVIAIGGIQPQHVNEVITTGAKGVALLTGVLLANDVTASALAYKKTILTEEG